MAWAIGNKQLPPALVDAFNGRTAIVTGSNGGVGEQVALTLAQSAGLVVIACRTVSKGEAARSRILALHPHARIEVEALDLSTLDSVQDFARRWKQRQHGTVDLLCCNAGAIQLERTKTMDGFELSYQANVLSHMLLVLLLLPDLAAAARPRIVFTSSGVAWEGTVDLDNFNMSKSPEVWRGLSGFRNGYQAYRNSKLIQCCAAEELRRRLAGTRQLQHVSVSLAHPGLVCSGFTNQAFPLPKIVLSIVNAACWLLGRSPKQGALSVLWASLAPSIDSSRLIYINCKPAAMPPACEDAALTRAVFDRLVSDAQADASLLT